MPRRVTLTDRQKDALLRLPTSQTDLLKHYTLSDEDLGHIRLRRRAHNRFGFALQLCVLRYPGRVLAPGELIPAEVIEFIGAQLARHPAHRRHHCCRDRRAKPDSAETRLLSAAERARDSPAGSRSRRAHPVHDRLDSGCRTPTACPDRAQQRRSSSCAEAGNQLPPPR